MVPQRPPALVPEYFNKVKPFIKSEIFQSRDQGHVDLGAAFTFREVICSFVTTPLLSKVIDPANGLVNPSNNLIFPRLSLFVPGFRRYRINNLSLSYYPACSATTAGSLVFGMRADPTDKSAYSDELSWIYEQGSTITPVYKPASIKLPLDAAGKWMFIQQDSQALDPRLAAYGNIFAATSHGGLDNAVFAGYITLEGTIEVTGLRPVEVEATLKRKTITAQILADGKQAPMQLTAPQVITQKGLASQADQQEAGLDEKQLAVPINAQILTAYESKSHYRLGVDAGYLEPAYYVTVPGAPEDDTTDAFLHFEFVNAPMSDEAFDDAVASLHAQARLGTPRMRPVDFKPYMNKLINGEWHYQMDPGSAWLKHSDREEVMVPAAAGDMIFRINGVSPSGAITNLLTYTVNQAAAFATNAIVKVADATNEWITTTVESVGDRVVDAISSVASWFGF